MHSHLLLMVLFAFLVAVVFALLTKEDIRDQVRFGGKVFGAFLAAALILGWLMYPFPL
jgi:hypothetical protein